MSESRTALLREIFAQGFRTPDRRHKEAPPVVPAEMFFAGNEDNECIAANLEDHPGVDFFQSKLAAIAAKQELAAVLVNIYDLDSVMQRTSTYSRLPLKKWFRSGLRIYVPTGLRRAGHTESPGNTRKRRKANVGGGCPGTSPKSTHPSGCVTARRLTPESGENYAVLLSGALWDRDLVGYRGER